MKSAAGATADLDSLCARRPKRTAVGTEESPAALSNKRKHRSKESPLQGPTHIRVSDAGPRLAWRLGAGAGIRNLPTFSRSDFTFDPERNIYICPAGKV